MELKRGLSPISSTYPPVCITPYATQNPLWKSETPPPLSTVSYFLHRSLACADPAGTAILEVHFPWVGRSHSVVSQPWGERPGDKSRVWKKNKKTLWRLHYLRAPQPVNEARVNCCWLDVSTHGWVSPQISLRGPQREKRERMRSLTDNDVESVSSVPPLWVRLRGRQIRNVDGATQRCILSAEMSNCSQNLGSSHGKRP